VAAEMAPDTRCVFNFVSSDVFMCSKRSVVAGEGLRARSSTISLSVAPYIIHNDIDLQTCVDIWGA